MNQRLATQPNSHGDLNEAVRQLQSREDFLGFLRLLHADLHKNPGQWANPDLPSFLEAMTAWGEDMEGYYQNRGEVVPEQPQWQLFGQMLLAARVYE